MTHFTLISRPTLLFRVDRFYQAAGNILSVVGITLDGKYSTVARVADVIARPDPAEDAP